MELSDGGFPPTPAQASGALIPTYRDRSNAIFALGVLEILGGGLSALMIPLMLLGLMFGRRVSGTGTPLRSFVPSALSYAILAIVLVTLGIGAIQLKRWARALNLILSWFLLIMGVFVIVLLLVILPSFLAGIPSVSPRNPAAPQLPTVFTAVMITLVIVLFTFFLVILPLVFMLFYRSKNVEETFRRRDPSERWTDRLPLPVIAATLLSSFGALYCLVLSFSTPLFPFFGRYLVGPFGTIGFLIIAAIDV